MGVTVTSVASAKPVPVSVTDQPGGPDAGVKPVMVGTAAAKATLASIGRASNVTTAKATVSGSLARREVEWQDSDTVPPQLVEL
jgi:hypothetical protein